MTYRFIQTSDWCLGQLDGHFARAAECHQSFTADIEDSLVIGRGLYVGLGTSFEGMGVGLSNFVLELGIYSWNRWNKEIPLGPISIISRKCECGTM